MDAKQKQYERQRKWREANPDYQKNYWQSRPKLNTKYKQRRRDYDKRNPEHRAAHQAVTYALRVGKLIRPDRCENCGTVTKVQADHADYSKKLEVTWLCQPCHNQITQERKKYE